MPLCGDWIIDLQAFKQKELHRLVGKLQNSCGPSYYLALTLFVGVAASICIQCENLSESTKKHYSDPHFIPVPALQTYQTPMDELNG